MSASVMAAIFRASENQTIVEGAIQALEPYYYWPTLAIGDGRPLDWAMHMQGAFR
jgi:hypothetical protein